MKGIMGGSRGGQGIRTPPPPIEKSQKIGFKQNWSRTSEKPSQHSMLGHHRPVSETPF